MEINKRKVQNVRTIFNPSYAFFESKRFLILSYVNFNTQFYTVFIDYC